MNGGGTQQATGRKHSDFNLRRIGMPTLTDKDRELLQCMIDNWERPEALTDEQRGSLNYMVDKWTQPPLTDEEREHLDYVTDTQRDTTQDGKLRCESLYKGSVGGELELMRCTEAARLRVLIKPEMALHYWAHCRTPDRKGEAYWALVCYGCCPHSDQIEELTKDHESPKTEQL